MRPRTGHRLFLAAALAAGLAACGQEQAAKKAADDAAAASLTPYAAIAAGKVDIEGGLVDIASRQPGIVSEVLV
jgi:HlyD family secretion protein